MASRKPTLLAMSVFSLLGLAFLFGCIQPPQAQRCATFSGLEKDRCLNQTAIWFQEPYICYSIANLNYRQSCLEKSVTPDEAQKLKNELLYGQQTAPVQILVEQPKPPANASANETAPAADAVDAKIKDCQKSENMSADGCARLVAIEMSDLSLCESIADDNYRSSCISNVALTSKDSSRCAGLKRSADVNICKYYSSGG